MSEKPLEMNEAFSAWLGKKQFQVGESVTAPISEASSMLIHVRGLKIHAKCGKGGVVNLVVSANQKHAGMLGRLRQHLANALFSAGDLCNPCYQSGPIRVVKSSMGIDSVDNTQPQGAGSDINDVWPLNLPNGNSYYNAFLVHESVKRHQKRGWFAVLSRRWWKKGADDSCSQDLSPLVSSDALANVTKVIVIPDEDNQHQAARP